LRQSVGFEAGGDGLICGTRDGRQRNGSGQLGHDDEDEVVEHEERTVHIGSQEEAGQILAMRQRRAVVLIDEAALLEGGQVQDVTCVRSITYTRLVDL